MVVNIVRGVARPAPGVSLRFGLRSSRDVVSIAWHTAGVASRELLRDALVLWRETRAESIAAVIDRITTQLSRGWEPPAPKLARTFHHAWLAAAADDVHRRWAARHVLDKLPDRSAAVRERLTALLDAGPDPRVAHELPLDKLTGFDDLVSQLVDTKPPVREPTASELARFAPPAHSADLAELERDIYANPDDDEPRAVLADLLQSRGDPRGELIALQLAVAAGRGTDEGDARIEELVRDYGRAWLGPLHEIAYRAELRRGFLSRLELAGAGPARWESVVDHPLLGTVEELIPGESTGERYAELITSPAMTALRRIEVFDLAVVGALGRTHARLVHVACPPLDLGRVHNPVRQFSDVVLPACLRFETLRSFACELAFVPDLMRSTIGARLTTLTVSGEVTAALALWRNFRQPIELVIAPHARLAGCSMTDVEGEGSIRARREGKRVIVQVAGPWGSESICDHWSLLPADRVELVEPILGATAARIDQLAAGRIEIVRISRERRSGIIHPM
jgi:uncharacterized protein (TIGR02996 family)